MSVAANQLITRAEDYSTVEVETFTSHLECGLTGERFAADRIHGLSSVGRPLVVRYDLDALGRSHDKETLAGQGWFTEGFDTADLIEAKALLEELC